MFFVMDVKTKVIIVLSVFGLLCSCWILYREITLHSTVSTEQHDIEIAEIKRDNAISTKQLEALHKRQYDALSEELYSKVALAESKYEDLKKIKNEARAVKIEAVKDNDSELAKLLAEKSGTPERDFSVATISVWMKKPSAIALLDKILKLETDLDLCSEQCAITVANAIAVTKLGDTKDLQKLELTLKGVEDRLRVSDADNKFKDEQIRVSKADALKKNLAIGFGVGIPALVIGGVVGWVISDKMSGKIVVVKNKRRK